MCGNKIDLEKREVTKEEGEALAQKEGIAFFETSAKTAEGIKNMFYSAVSDLSIFAENNNKENLLKELMEENGVENVVEGIKPQENEQAPAKNINIDGQQQPVVNNTPQKKGKKCGC